VGEREPYVGTLDGRGMRLAVVAGRFNAHVTRPLLDGARSALRVRGVDPDDVPVHWVPGVFEVPLVAKRLASSGSVDAVICLGAVIRGETAHFEYVAGPCASSIARVAIDTGVPVIFGVLTTDNDQQALDRAGGRMGNKGAEAVDAAIEMVTLLRELPGAAAC
jgi:6,7-dimethyl-8-ribityllumazine synthase